MTQEDGFIEVKCYLTNHTPILKWVRPVITKKLRLLFDVMSVMIYARDSGVNFDEMNQMENSEQLAWMVYGGMKSYSLMKNRKLDISIEQVMDLLDGVLIQDRAAIYETISASRQLGEVAKSYQEAREALAEQGDGISKKVEGQVSGH